MGIAYRAVPTYLKDGSMKEKSKKKNKLGKWPYIFVAPFLISYLAFYLYPMLYSFAGLDGS